MMILETVFMMTIIILPLKHSFISKYFVWHRIYVQLYPDTTDPYFSFNGLEQVEQRGGKKELS